MRATLAALFLAAGSAAALASQPGDEIVWFADFDQATERAAADGKDLLVKFTGSDWCPPCKRLEAEVFSHDNFASALAGDFVLVKLDYPNGAEARAKVPNATRNREVLQQFGIQGYPTVLLMTVDGVPYAQTGYRPGGVEPYLAHVREIQASGREHLSAVLGLVERFEAAEGDERLALVGEAADVLADMDASPLARRLAPVVRHGAKLEGEQHADLVGRCLGALLRSGVADANDLGAARVFDADNAKGLFERAVLAEMRGVRNDGAAKQALAHLDQLLRGEHGIHDDEVAQQVALTAVTWCVHILEDPERAERYADYVRQRFAENAELLEVLEEILAD